MRYDRDMEYARHAKRRGWGERTGRGEYGATYEAPYGGGYEATYAAPYQAPYRARFHGFGMGYAGGALRSRGSYEAGQLRSGLNPVDEFEFEWGDGYVGGRGYGGTNYDLEHGYLTGGVPRYPAEPPAEAPERTATSPATRGGYAWGEHRRGAGEPFGPARYGYGPYHRRLRRPRRSDDEVREDVESTLYYDTWVDADAIDVRVEEGVVTLSGTLPSYDEVRYATDDTWDVDGVRGVRIELNVGERRARPDQWTETRGRAEQAGQPSEEGAGPSGEEGAPAMHAAAPGRRRAGSGPVSARKGKQTSRPRRTGEESAGEETAAGPAAEGRPAEGRSEGEARGGEGGAAGAPEQS